MVDFSDEEIEIFKNYYNEKSEELLPKYLRYKIMEIPISMTINKIFTYHKIKKMLERDLK